MLQRGVISQSASGVYHLLPLGWRALEKLVALIDREMAALGGRRMAMPVLASAQLWKASGRWEEIGSELMRLHDRSGAEFCLGPTHEELVTELVARLLDSYRQLPLRLYQIDRKFRDELRPRFGLMRAREFWMKDMYTFDCTEEEALKTYEQVSEAYERILTQLELPFIRGRASSGAIGGSLSHEYHVPSELGEDTVLTCQRCGLSSNQEVLAHLGTSGSLPDCPHGGSACQLSESKGVEVAHSFVLGTKYSSVFNTTFTDSTGKKRLVEMGCYGIGVSRLLAAAVEHGCSKDSEETGLVWPVAIAPYHICILPVTADVTSPAMQEAEALYDSLHQRLCPGDIVLDDRVHLSVGARLKDTSGGGYPVTILTGGKTPVGSYSVALQGRAEPVVVTGTEELLEMLKVVYIRQVQRQYNV